MLSYMRKNAGSWLIKILLVGVALSFVIGFGILPGLKDSENQGLIVAQIGEQKITKGEWDRAHDNLVTFYKQIYKEGFSEEMLKSMGLREQALENLINTALQIKEANRLGFQVSKKALQKKIHSLPVFQTEGQYDHRKYLRLLNLNRLNPAEFEKSQKEELLLKAYQRYIMGMIKISDEELWNLFQLENEKTNLEVMVINPRMLETAVTVTEENLSNYFTANENRYKTPLKVKVAYAQLPAEKFESLVKLYTGDIEDYYHAHSDEFSVPEEIHLRHILLKTTANTDTAIVKEKRRLLEELKDRIQKGEDFSLLAKEYSEDEGSAPKGGDLGYVKKGDLVSEVETTAFSLKPGDLSEIVSSSYGLHLLKVDDYRAAKVTSLSEAEEEIRKKLTTEKSWHLARRKAEEFVWSSKEKKDFPSPDAGNEDKIFTKKTDYFPLAGPVPELGYERSFQEAAFALQEGEISNVIKGRKGYFILKKLEEKLPEVPPFEEVRKRVEQDFRREESKKLALEKAKTLLAQAKEGKSFTDISADEKLQSFETGPFSRLEPSIPLIGAAADLKEAAFSLTAQAPLPERPLEVGEKHYIIKFKEKTLPDKEAFLAEKQSFRGSQIRMKADAIFRQRLSELRKEVKFLHLSS